jgi:drug/metabolite transporter (DMT)-like permease
MEKPKSNPKLIAVLQALLVTFLWSTSWVLVKFGLEDIPALTFAGMRYFLAFLVLLPFYLRSKQAIPIRQLNKGDWFILVIYGLVYYTLTQGTQFLGLAHLPAITLSLLLNFSAPIVALLGIPLLKEYLTWQQWIGIGIFLVGVYAFFYPVDIPPGLVLGLVIGMVSVLATSAGSIIGRFINRAGRLDALTVTVVSMGIGSVVLLGVGLLTEEAPTLNWTAWAIVLWLAVVNSAFAFTLWNHTLRTLSATESSMINNTMLVQVAVLAWLFLGETPTGMEILGMAVVLVGVILVNLKWKKE